HDPVTEIGNEVDKFCLLTIKENKVATGYGESKSLTIIIEGKQCVDEINRFLYFLLFSNLLK
ncbi:MAG: hypothetical protein MUO60_16160, partial [Clostridiaceae bacterium]|nr:hypothetical protein [Clostridiaceae bacterium]